jgi:hypothetical protein
VLSLTGGWLSGPLSFGQRLAADDHDLSQHITLYDGWGGFNITGGSLNVVAGGTAQMSFHGDTAQMQVPLYQYAAPTDPNELVNKAYVDNAIAALAAKLGASQWDMGMTAEQSPA